MKRPVKPEEARNREGTIVVIKESKLVEPSTSETKTETVFKSPPARKVRAKKTSSTAAALTTSDSSDIETPTKKEEHLSDAESTDDTDKKSTQSEEMSPEEPVKRSPRGRKKVPPKTETDTDIVTPTRRGRRQPKLSDTSSTTELSDPDPSPIRRGRSSLKSESEVSESGLEDPVVSKHQTRRSGIEEQKYDESLHDKSEIEKVEIPEETVEPILVEPIKKRNIRKKDIPLPETSEETVEPILEEPVKKRNTRKNEIPLLETAVDTVEPILEKQAKTRTNCKKEMPLTETAEEIVEPILEEPVKRRNIRQKDVPMKETSQEIVEPVLSGSVKKRNIRKKDIPVSEQNATAAGLSENLLISNTSKKFKDIKVDETLVESNTSETDSTKSPIPSVSNNRRRSKGVIQDEKPIETDTAETNLPENLTTSVSITRKRGKAVKSDENSIETDTTEPDPTETQIPSISNIRKRGKAVKLDEKLIETDTTETYPIESPIPSVSNIKKRGRAVKLDVKPIETDIETDKSEDLAPVSNIRKRAKPVKSDERATETNATETDQTENSIPSVTNVRKRAKEIKSDDKPIDTVEETTKTEDIDESHNDSVSRTRRHESSSDSLTTAATPTATTRTRRRETTFSKLPETVEPESKADISTSKPLETDLESKADISIESHETTLTRNRRGRVAVTKTTVDTEPVEKVEVPEPRTRGRRKVQPELPVQDSLPIEEQLKIEIATSPPTRTIESKTPVATLPDLPNVKQDDEAVVVVDAKIESVERVRAGRRPVKDKLKVESQESKASISAPENASITSVTENAELQPTDDSKPEAVNTVEENQPIDLSVSDQLANPLSELEQGVNLGPARRGRRKEVAPVVPAEVATDLTTSNKECLDSVAIETKPEPAPSPLRNIRRRQQSTTEVRDVVDLSKRLEIRVENLVLFGDEDKQGSSPPRVRLPQLSPVDKAKLKPAASSVILQQLSPKQMTSSAASEQQPQAVKNLEDLFDQAKVESVVTKVEEKNKDENVPLKKRGRRLPHPSESEIVAVVEKTEGDMSPNSRRGRSSQHQHNQEQHEQLPQLEQIPQEQPAPIVSEIEPVLPKPIFCFNAFPQPVGLLESGDRVLIRPSTGFSMEDLLRPTVIQVQPSAPPQPEMVKQRNKRKGNPKKIVEVQYDELDDLSDVDDVLSKPKPGI